MLSLLKHFLSALYESAVLLNHKNIIGALSTSPNCDYLDIGCDDGQLTLLWAEKIGTKKISGIEIVSAQGEKSRSKGISILAFNLNESLQVPSESFDIITANQVVEHLYNSDIFLKEMFRVLRPGGTFIISTENASSWCNVFAAILGWQIFSLTNFSNFSLGIGNPFSLHKGKNPENETWNHVRIYNYRGLLEYCQLAGFTVEKTFGAGYFPLPSWLGNFDKVHCHFLTLKLKKPL